MRFARLLAAAISGQSKVGLVVLFSVFDRSNA
jgi:hypothetical protein